MKLLSLVAVATAIGGVCAAPAMAQDSPAPASAPAAEPEAPHKSGFYAGAGINLYFVDRDYLGEPFGLVFEDHPSPGAFMGRLGYAFNENLAVEIEAGFGGANQDFTISGGGADGNVGVETPVAAHVVGILPFGDSYYLMGKAGYASATITEELFNAEVDLTLNGPSFGAGLGWRNGALDFRFEYAMITGGTGESGVLGMYVMNHF